MSDQFPPPPPPPPPSAAPPPPGGSVPNYLVQAILATLFCCLPFGVVSIVYAAQVNGKLSAGDYAGAVSASNNARTWAWVSVIAGVVVVVLVLATGSGGRS